MTCHRCYELFVPFMGETQSSLLSAHPPCIASPLKSKKELQTARKRRSTMFSKRRRTILRKAHGLHEDCSVDVYLVVRNRSNNQIWQYSNGYIPPSVSELTEIYPVPIILGPENFKKEELMEEELVKEAVV